MQRLAISIGYLWPYCLWFWASGDSMALCVQVIIKGPSGVSALAIPTLPKLPCPLGVSTLVCNTNTLFYMKPHAA